MVLRDDSFASIVEAIRQGRTIFGNIRKFVIFMLSGNTGQIFAVSVVAFLKRPAAVAAPADPLHQHRLRRLPGARAGRRGRQGRCHEASAARPEGADL